MEHTKLLYVEDDMEVIENIKYLMSPYFTEIEIAQDGKEALKKFITFEPDVIVTDIQMPNMNGLEFVKNIREVDDKLPIVFLTAHNDSGKLMQAIELGAVAYVKKPFSLEVLKSAINKAIRTSMEHRKNSELLKEMDI
ncbi:MAG: response regulator, partial [Campylobacterota bacterium]|nr:response regulator [Campylobacterota bacterium]